MTSNAYGGIRVKNLDKINTKYLCVACLIVLWRPYQLNCCGTLLCEGCLADQQPFVCPKCVTRKQMREAQFDRAVDREMKTMTVECFNCKWTGIFENYLKHLESKHNDFHCTECQERFFSKNAYRQHRFETCKYRSLSCELPNCEISIKYNKMHEHYLTDSHQNTLYKSIVKSRRKKRVDYRPLKEVYQRLDSTFEILNNELVRSKTAFSHERTNLDKMKSEIDQLKTTQKQSNEQLDNSISNLTTIQTEIHQIQRSDIPILDSNASIILSINYPLDSTKVSTVGTSSYGYLFSIRLSTTVIKSNQYLSLIVNLLNGQYNNILPFPFLYNIHFILCDQSNQHSDFVYVLKPTHHLSAFIRPTHEKNDDIHIPDFCLMDTVINKYVRDGKFFLRIFIDFF